jgi:hypothetical protein
MLEWYLVAWLFIGGQWVQGDNLDGWHAIQQPSFQVCQEKLKRANAINLHNRDKVRFSCDLRGENEETNRA